MSSLCQKIACRIIKLESMFTTRAVANHVFFTSIKGAVTDMRYFERSKFSRSLVHKKNFSLTWEVVFELGYAFCQEK